VATNCSMVYNIMYMHFSMYHDLNNINIFSLIFIAIEQAASLVFVHILLKLKGRNSVSQRAFQRIE
jgi:hypothetical protein